MDSYLIIAIRALLVPLRQQATTEAKAASTLETYDAPAKVRDTAELLDRMLMQYQAEQLNALKPATEPKANTGGTEG